MGESVITIRAMESGDVEEISRLCDALGYPATSDAVARRFFALSSSARDIVFVAIDGGMVVGWLYLKRAWRLGAFWQELSWRIRRRRFKVMPPRDDDRWIH